MKPYRLNRLFNAKSGRCFDVAIDHGFFNQPGFLEGIEDMERAVVTVVRAGPEPALQAVRLDAACMCVNLIQIPGAPEVTNQCIKNISALKLESERYGMPMMVEPLVFRPNSEAGGYMVDGDGVKIQHLVRQAVELGADLIKADPTDDILAYHEVIRVAGGIPVLVRGGGRAPDHEILYRTECLMKQGASGIVYGRNVVQHASPASMVAALMSIVHDGATAKQAALQLKAN